MSIIRFILKFVVLLLGAITFFLIVIVGSTLRFAGSIVNFGMAKIGGSADCSFTYKQPGLLVSESCNLTFPSDQASKITVSAKAIALSFFAEQQAGSFSFIKYPDAYIKSVDISLPAVKRESAKKKNELDFNLSPIKYLTYFSSVRLENAVVTAPEIKISFGANLERKDDSFKLSLINLSGSLGEARLKGGVALLTSPLPPKFANPLEGEFSFKEVNYVTTLTENLVKFRLNFGSASPSKQRIEVLNIRTNLLGGAVTNAKPITFPLEEGQIIDLQLNEFDLAKLLELVDRGVYGSGLIDGTLPLRYSHGALVVKESRLSARAPGGTLKYAPSEEMLASANSNENIHRLITALKNYHFTKLEINADSKENGDARVQLGLEGNNPDFMDGHQTNLNVSVEENIPMLIRSIKLATRASNEEWKN